MEVRWYTAKDYINSGDPVFLYHSNKKEKDYAYSSYNNTTIDGGQPVCIGVAINSASKEKTVKVAISGTVDVNYIGDVRTIMTDVYIITKYKSKTYTHGRVSYLCNDITPFIFEKHHIIKVGTLYPSNNDGVETKGYVNSNFAERKMKIQLSIENQNFNYHNIGNFGLVPNNVVQIEDGVNNFTFSYQDIAGHLKTGLEHPDVISKFNDIIYDVSHSKEKRYTIGGTQVEGLYKTLNAYCETLMSYIPNPLQNGAPEFIKRLIVTSSSGQMVYDSENDLRIWDTVGNDLTKIPLIANPFGETEFILGDSIVNAHLYPYIDTTLAINSWVLKSGYTSPVNTTYQMIKSTINGIGYGERYDPVTNLYNFAVSAFIGTTANVNKHNSEGLIVQLNWMQDPTIASEIWAVNVQYQIILENYPIAKEQCAIAAQAKATAVEKDLLCKTKRDEAIAAVNGGNYTLARSLAFEIFLLSNDIKSLLETATTAKNTAETALINAANAYAIMDTYKTSPYYDMYLKYMVEDGYAVRIKTEQEYVCANAAYMQTEIVLGTSYDYAIEAWLASNSNNAVPTTGWIYPLGSGTDTLRIKSPNNRLLLDGGDNNIGTFVGLYYHADSSYYNGLFITNPFNPSMSNGKRTFPATFINESVPRNYGFLSRMRITYKSSLLPVAPATVPVNPFVAVSGWGITTSYNSGTQIFTIDLLANDSSSYMDLSSLTTDMVQIASLALTAPEYDIISGDMRKSYVNASEAMHIKYVIYDETKTSGNYVELETYGYNGITAFTVKPSTQKTTYWLKNNPNNINLAGNETTYNGTPV